MYTILITELLSFENFRRRLGVAYLLVAKARPPALRQKEVAGDNDVP
jgi:hypothetical protein